MVDVIWVVLCAALVLLMQAGFACLEAGLVRHKNNINVAIKNLMDLCVSGAVFWLVGFGLMFSTSFDGWVGVDLGWAHRENTPFFYAFFLFQLMFCGTATTIISGAVAERMSFMGYMLVAVVLASIIYPISGHWAWNGLFQGHSAGWLGKAGFIDFAGSTVVHSVGGWGALSAALIIGPRVGRFESGKPIPGSNLPMSVLGVMLIWFGWFGFNGGSTLAATEAIPLILLNTFVAAVFGGLSAAIFMWLYKRKLVIGRAINGVLGGLVAITASCHLMTPTASVLIGIVAGVLVCVGEQLLAARRIDDVVGAVPVHLFCGIWGTLALPFLSDPQNWGTGLTVWQQFFVQLQAVVAIGGYAFSVSYLSLVWANRYFPLRVTREAELLGLNMTEHGASNDIYDLLDQMQRQERDGNFSQTVAEEPFTEAGQIARQYNKVLHKVNEEIERREQVLNEFRTSESRKGAILNAALDCIVTIDTAGKIREFNPAAEKCFGLSGSAVMNQSFMEMFVPENLREDFFASLAGQFSINSGLALNRHNRINLQRMPGNEFPAELSITQVELGEKKALKEFTFHIRDISRQVELHNKMRTLAFNDVLTGLYNRYFFKERLAQEIDFACRHGSDVLVMFLDLDKFKSINDTLGHNAGDILLCHVAGLLTSSLRPEDVICRWGGDEFIILIIGMSNPVQIAAKAEEILEVLNTPVVIEGREIFAQTSIGIAVSNNGLISSETLIQRADMAMYEAKQRGRNNYCFFLKEMEDKVNHRFFYENELRKAIQNQEFEVFYQPKVDCQSATLVGFEALIRWRHPDQGFIPPNKFIPILEESGLINDVTHWVIGNVCQRLDIWQRSELPVLPVAVNLSFKDLLAEDCYSRVRHLLLDYQIPGRLLEFEITETMLATNTEQCIQLMNQFKQMGISFSVDDFGTGYSSMSYLQKFPLDTLKIDQAFVRDCTTDREVAAICQAIAALAKSLGLKIIAEGVENEDQLEFFKQLQCNAYQGFLYSPPLSADDLEVLLKDHAKCLIA